MTNPSQRATLQEVLSHPWMLRSFSGPPSSHLLQREPLHADNLDLQVIRGMTGFEFGSEGDIEVRLRRVLESDAYRKAVEAWERKRDIARGITNGLSSRSWTSQGTQDSTFTGRASASVDSISRLDTTQNGQSNSSPNKKSKRFSGFEYYRKKLFSPATSPPNSPSGGHMSHSKTAPSFGSSHFNGGNGGFGQTHSGSSGFFGGSGSSGPNAENVLDPTSGFHPLISIYYLVRERIERERVYGPGVFASSQLSLLGVGDAPTSAGVPGVPKELTNGKSSSSTPPPTTQVPTTSTPPPGQAQAPPLFPTTAVPPATGEPIPTSPVASIAGPRKPSTNGFESQVIPPSPQRPPQAHPISPKKSGSANYNMPLPRLPAPETSHYSGMSYDTAGGMPPQSPTAGQPRPRATDGAVLPSSTPPPPSVTTHRAVPPIPSTNPTEGPTSPTQSIGLGLPPGTLPRAPPQSTHRRSHSLSQRPSVLRGWAERLGNAAHGGLAPHTQSPTRPDPSLPPTIQEPPRTAGPEVVSFSQRQANDRVASGRASADLMGRRDVFTSDEEEKGENKGSHILSPTSTLARKFTHLLGGRDSKDQTSGRSKRSSMLVPAGFDPTVSPRLSGDEKSKSPVPSMEKPLPSVASTEKHSETENEMERIIEEKERDTSTPTQTSPQSKKSKPPTTGPPVSFKEVEGPLPTSQSQPTANLHRRAATVLDPSTQNGGKRVHERRGSAGSMGRMLGGQWATTRRPDREGHNHSKRPSTAGSSTGAGTLLGSRNDKKTAGWVPEGDAHGVIPDEDALDTEEKNTHVAVDDDMKSGDASDGSGREGGSATSEIRPVYLKGLFS